MPSTSRSIVILVACTFCLCGVIGVLTGALLPNIIASFELSKTQAGFLIAFWSISFVVGSSISARLSSSYPLNAIFSFASALSAIALLGLFISNSIWPFALAFGIGGSMMGILVTIGHSIIGASFPDGRTSMLSALDVVFTLGSLSAPLGVLAISSAGLSWKISYAVLAAFFVFLAIGVRAFMPTVSAPKENLAEEKTDEKPFLKMPHIVLLGITGLMLGTVEWAQNSWIVSYTLEKDYTEFSAQMGFAIFLSGMLIARIITVFSANWLQRGNTSVYILSLAVIGNLTLIYGPSITTLTIGNFLTGFGIGAIFPIALGRAMDFAPTKAAIASSALLMGVIAGSQIASIFLGWLADVSGGIDIAFRATTPFFILLLFAYWVFRNSTQSKHKP